jgi:syntaxin 1B/2/3
MVDVVYRYQSATTAPERRIAVASFEATVLDANTRLRDAKAAVDTMQKSNVEFQEKYGEERSSEYGFRVAAVSGHTKRLRGLFTRIASAQTMFEAETSRRIEVHGVNEIMEQQTGRTPMATPTGTPRKSTVAKAFESATLEEQRMKEDDMKRVEKSLREIREAFLQIAALVDAQGEMLDCIEFSVVNAKNYSHQANLQLIKARKKQRQRSMLWCICGIILALAIVFGILGILQVTGAANIFGK